MDRKIFLILNPSNSRGLKKMPVQTLLQCLLKNGLKIQMLLGLSKNQEDMAEHLLTTILPLNLLHVRLTAFRNNQISIAKHNNL